MIKFCIPITLCILLLLATDQGQAQPKLSFLDPNDHVVEIPFEISQNLIILPLRINGSKRMNFVLDSGLSSTLITELTGIDTVSLNFAKEVRLTGLGDGDAGLAYTSSGNEIRLETPDQNSRGIIGKNMNVYILTGDQFSLSRQLGLQVNGLVGSEFFHAFVVDIDYQHKLIRFIDPEHYTGPRRMRRYTEIPVNIVRQKAYVSAKLTQANNTSIDLQLLMDTGASLAMWMAPFTDPNIRVPNLTIPALLGQGLNGEISGCYGRVKSLQLGQYTMENPIIAYPDSSSVSSMMTETTRNGSLGNDIMRRFRLIFDYPHNRVFLKPNGNFREPFSYNSSGMELEKPYYELPYYVVYHVMEGSPAQIAGVQRGDQLIMINYNLTHSMTLDEINSILHGHESKTIKIRVLRDQEEFKMRFKLNSAL